ncbi:tol-pal system protein YbgF [Neptuniibacter sp. CAU 1671]|uniref:tol-pal system protein YbgF n=1 Tax=Neptuniibacter sp. CAU 1671 TaxID=3032593 RepID=UPI0023DB6965|nr:tol-pal system protein YbgF [Neptuniibacter sp. CAU 1671]MDF2180701.1 tol-pal system protein YbgF [Neptuniibacter sp. CAU 1671]
MRYCKSLAYAGMALLCSANTFAEDVPVIELGAERGANTINVATPPQQSLSQNGQLLMLIQQLQDEVRSLRGQVEQQSYRLKQMEQEQLDRYRDLDRRVSVLLSANADAGLPPPAEPVFSDTQSAGTSANSAAPSSADATSVTAAQPAPTEDDMRAYREAFALVRDKSYGPAIAAFNAFVQQYPQSPRLANAHYWLGEVYLVQQNVEAARDAFTTVLNSFPQSSKAPDSAYKLATVYEKLGDPARSSQYLDLVLKQYPDSAAARLAKEFQRTQ